MKSAAHLGRDDELAVRLAMAGRELGKELVVGNARRGCQTGFLEDARANLLGGSRCGRQATTIFRDIEIGLIERQRLDQRRIFRKDGMDLVRDGAIDVETRRHEHEFGAKAHRRGRRHGRAHAEDAGLITCCRNHAPLGTMAYRHGAPLERRIVALFDRRIERVHVDVDDLAHRHGATISRPKTKRTSVSPSLPLTPPPPRPAAYDRNPSALEADRRGGIHLVQVRVARLAGLKSRLTDFMVSFLKGQNLYGDFDVRRVRLVRPERFRTPDPLIRSQLL